MEEQNHEIQRGVDLLSSLLTVGNLFFGYISVLSSARGTPADLDFAARAIGWAVLFDTLDGRVARLRKGASHFGKELDSLADVISFGVAPAFLALVWGLRGVRVEAAANPELALHIYQAGWIACFCFLICGAWRLARFNILPASPAADPGVHAHRDFIGMPIPAGAAVVAALVHAFQEPLYDWRWAAAWTGLVLVLAFLMVSPIRYPSFKDVSLGGRHRSLIGIAVLIALIYFYSRHVLLILAGGYLLIGLVGAVRRRLTGPHA
ncbi:MAG: CDP-diacylglycerol--serine O-phosphatidyltransferase [Candidatus Acidiferrales bacterium]